MLDITSYRKLQINFVLFQASQISGLTSYPVSLTAKKSMKLNFFTEKIYYISSQDVPYRGIRNTSNPCKGYLPFNLCLLMSVLEG